MVKHYNLFQTPMQPNSLPNVTDGQTHKEPEIIQQVPMHKAPSNNESSKSTEGTQLENNSKQAVEYDSG